MIVEGFFSDVQIILLGVSVLLFVFGCLPLLAPYMDTDYPFLSSLACFWVFLLSLTWYTYLHTYKYVL